MKFIKTAIYGGVLLCFGIAFFWFYHQFRGTSEKGPSQRFIIGIKTTNEQLADDLQNKGFIKNKRLFWIFLNVVCRQRKTCLKGDPKLEPGAYLISQKMNLYQLAGTLAYGPFQKWVLIPPGKRKEQAALILQRALNWSDQIVLSFINEAKEGYLFPDTYLIDIDADPRQVVQKLLNNYNEKFDAQLQKDLLANNIRNDTALKIASLVERESGGDEDKPLIAGIIWNRLEKKMRLEIDATVQYAIVSQQIVTLATNYQPPSADFNFWPILGPGIVRTIDSPYNTYRIKALPPGPICSPGLSSLKAVAYPAETDALYYLHSSDKQIHTAKTYKEHLENIKKYLE